MICEFVLFRAKNNILLRMAGDMRKRAKASFLGHLTSSKPRLHTVSVALPGSIVANQSSKELRTYLSGQIARSLGIFQVDEVVVYDDKLHGATVCRLLRLGTVT